MPKRSANLLATLSTGWGRRAFDLSVSSMSIGESFESAVKRRKMEDEAAVPLSAEETAFEEQVHTLH